MWMAELYLYAPPSSHHLLSFSLSQTHGKIHRPRQLFSLRLAHPIMTQHGCQRGAINRDWLVDIDIWLAAQSDITVSKHSPFLPQHPASPHICTSWYSNRSCWVWLTATRCSRPLNRGMGGRSWCLYIRRHFAGNAPRHRLVRKGSLCLLLSCLCSRPVYCYGAQ